MFQTDQEVLEAIRSGKQREAALTWVYQQGRAQLRSMEHEFNCSAEDCEDAFQEAVLSLYNKAVAGQFTLTAKLTTYVYQVCKNQLMYRQRSRRTMPMVEFADADDFVEEESLEDELSEQEGRLVPILDQLGERCRAIIMEFYAGGNSLKELAVKYQYRNVETVTSQKHRCMTQLRQKFQVA